MLYSFIDNCAGTWMVNIMTYPWYPCLLTLGIAPFFMACFGHMDLITSAQWSLASLQSSNVAGAGKSPKKMQVSRWEHQLRMVDFPASHVWTTRRQSWWTCLVNIRIAYPVLVKTGCSCPTFLISGPQKNIHQAEKFTSWSGAAT